MIIKIKKWWVWIWDWVTKHLNRCISFKLPCIFLFMFFHGKVLFIYWEEKSLARKCIKWEYAFETTLKRFNKLSFDCTVVWRTAYPALKTSFPCLFISTRWHPPIPAHPIPYSLILLPTVSSGCIVLISCTPRVNYFFHWSFF